MTSGDYFQDGSDDLVVAFESTDGDVKNVVELELYSTSDPAASGCGIASLLYVSSSWKVRALTTGSFYEDGVEYIAVGFKSGVTSRVYLMDGTTGTFVKKIVDDTSDLSMTAMTSGYFDGSNHQLITAWRTAAGGTEVYRGSGTSYGYSSDGGGVEDVGLLYSSSSWRVTHLWSDELRSGSGEEVITVFQMPVASPERIQIWLGDGTDLTLHYKLHEWN